MFISLRELTSLFTGLFAGSNPRKIDGGATIGGVEVEIAGEPVLLSAASATKRRVIIQNSKRALSASEVVAIGPATVTLASGYLLSVDSAVLADDPKIGDGGQVTLSTQDAVYGIATAEAAVRVTVESD